MALNIDNINISKADLREYAKLLSNEQYDRAEELFITKYILTLNAKYSEFLKDRMLKASSKVLSNEEMGKITLEISGASSSLQNAYKRLFTQFSNIYTNSIFKTIGVTSPAVKNAIKKATIAQFLSKVETSLSGTNVQILSSIRTIQQDLIIINQKIDKAVETGQILAKDIEKFKAELMKDLTKRNKNFYEIIKDDRFITYSNGVRMPLDSYSDMAIRTTLLNVERTAIEVKATAKNQRVVEFYERDHRKVITEREICKTVLRQKLYSISMVALDREAASILNIPYIEDIKEKGSFGPNCRHSFKLLNKQNSIRIENLLYFGSQEAV